MRRCVNCGKYETLCRHSVIPHCFRQWFPEHVKSHSSHDVVLLCPPCSISINLANQKRMQQLSDEFEIPIMGFTQKYTSEKDLARVVSCARALLKSPSLPEKRREELEGVVKSHLNKQELSKEDIVSASRLQTKRQNFSHRTFAEEVMSRLQADEQLEEFVIGWRRHFLQHFQPKHLPEHWSPLHPVFENNEPYFSPALTPD